MFATATILIDRSTDEVYQVLSNLRTQVPFWEIFFVPGLESISDDTLEANCFYQGGVKQLECVIGLHLTRPGAGLVTRVQTAIGELAAEWRIIDESGRTRVEVNIEGRGSGPTSNISIRQLAPKVLARLKAHFDKS
jgi:hypothetical protein